MKIDANIWMPEEEELYTQEHVYVKRTNRDEIGVFLSCVLVSFYVSRPMAGVLAAELLEAAEAGELS